MIEYSDFATAIETGNEAREHAGFIPMDSQEYKQSAIDSILLHRKAMIIQCILAYKYYGKDSIKVGNKNKPYYSSVGTII